MESNPTTAPFLKLEIGDFVIKTNTNFLDIEYKGKMIATLQEMNGSIGIFTEEMEGQPEPDIGGEPLIIKWFNLREQP